SKQLEEVEVTPQKTTQIIKSSQNQSTLLGQNQTTHLPESEFTLNVQTQRSEVAGIATRDSAIRPTIKDQETLDVTDFVGIQVHTQQVESVNIIPHSSSSPAPSPSLEPTTSPYKDVTGLSLKPEIFTIEKEYLHSDHPVTTGTESGQQKITPSTKPETS
ncbi:unnamed protein product, partial [Lymnaea stagnalis]